jgi:PAS domain S-box-containing protein
VPHPLIDLADLQVGAEDALGAILGTVRQPIWVVDPDGTIRYANPAAIAALGYDSADELLGRPSHTTIHHSHPDGTPYPASECPMLRPRLTGETVSSELDWFFRRDGSMFPVSYVSAPLEMQEGRGAVVAFTDIADRMRAERALREHDDLLAGEPAALRRVGALVAGGAAPTEVFAAIVREVGEVVGLPMVALWRFEQDRTATVIGEWSEAPHPFHVGTRWPLDGPTITAQVLATARPARIEDFTVVAGTIAGAARDNGIRSCAGAPIIVDGEVWGAMSADSTDPAPLAEGIEHRLAEFTELVATAISSSARREQLVRLAAEQAALRRVATLVAEGVASDVLFAAAAEEAGRLFGATWAGMIRYVGDNAVTAVATWGQQEHPEVSGLWSLDGDVLATAILRTARPARQDDWALASGPIAAYVREKLGVRSSVGCPIVVEGGVWGALFVHSTTLEHLPPETEGRLGGFTELLSTAIANAQSRAEVGRLADEQAALRRVATLVAEGVVPEALFAAATEEAGRLLGADVAGMVRYEGDDVIAPVAQWSATGELPRLPDQWPMDDADPARVVARTRRPLRVDDWAEVTGPSADFLRDALGIAASVGAPVIVEGAVWGVLAVHSRNREPLAADTEARLVSFAELVGTAIANAQARAEVARLADEQAALRRVATLVAQESPPEEVFAAVAEEVGHLLPAEDTAVMRYEDDAVAVVVAVWGPRSEMLEVGTRLDLAGENVTTVVHRTGRPARIDDYRDATGAIGDNLHRLGIRSAVGCPIVVEGRVWGVMIVAQGVSEPLPAEAETRMGKFTELVATAISNVQARWDLAASRARIVAAADDERRRVVRDLHDGAQQRLVHTIVTLKLAGQADHEELTTTLVGEALDHAERAIVELRELSHGILPSVLTRGGLRAGVETLASRMPVPVDIAVADDRLPPAVEATAYFVVAEALTNVAKHSKATRAAVLARVENGSLELQVRDDGAGGARPDGTGLVGLADRLAVLDGRLRVDSPPGRGTLVAADIPLR